MSSETIAAQIVAVRAELETRPTGLIAHVQRVLVEALELAAIWDLDRARVELAVWGHDLFRSFPAEGQVALAREVGLTVSVADKLLPVLLHGPIAAVVLHDRFGVTDQDVIDAVAKHSVGAPEMPLIGKVILLADKFEKRKRARTPVMAEIRRLARRDLDLALLCWADWKWLDERERDWASDAGHWAARVAWVAAHHDEAGLPARALDGRSGGPTRG